MTYTLTFLGILVGELIFYIVQKIISEYRRRKRIHEEIERKLKWIELRTLSELKMKNL